ncbi:uncharacterized protein LOC119170673 [Rhipicephalus microplus]|uniref:uncharacterized protein LOC119170673 n=1 Tax=Rhipicephalus microplus TaxID=6941 RepID=UPI003F6C9752
MTSVVDVPGAVPTGLRRLNCSGRSPLLGLLSESIDHFHGEQERGLEPAHFCHSLSIDRSATAAGDCGLLHCSCGPRERRKAIAAVQKAITVEKRQLVKACAREGSFRGAAAQKLAARWPGRPELIVKVVAEQGHLPLRPGVRDCYVYLVHRCLFLFNTARVQCQDSFFFVSCRPNSRSEEGEV